VAGEEGSMYFVDHCTYVCFWK